jgi:hypothetical protein
MAFRLIKNKAQDIAVKGAVVTLVAAILLQIFHMLDLDETLPFLLVWIMVWLIGSSIDSKSDNEAE